jgi:hypothetical protein
MRSPPGSDCRDERGYLLVGLGRIHPRMTRGSALAGSLILAPAARRSATGGRSNLAFPGLLPSSMLFDQRLKLCVLAISACSVGAGLLPTATATASTRSRVMVGRATKVPALAVPARVKNVNFKGTWVSGSGNWTVKSENLTTGVCAGTTAFVGYTFSGCKVTGNKYRFVVSQNGTSYRSINTGTIAGNTVKGSFNDGRGGTSYVAHRR